MEKAHEMSSVKLSQFRHPTPAEMRAIEIAARRARAAEIRRLLGSFISTLKAILASADRSSKAMRHA
jgi:hypothetical protein